MGKLNETTIVNSINSEYVLLTDSNGLPVRINKSNFAEAVRNTMGEVSIDKKGLLGSGKYGLLYIGDTSIQNIVLRLGSKSHATILMATGTYLSPALIGITLGMTGGANSGLPSLLKTKTLCGTPCIASAKAFYRNSKNHIQIRLSTPASWNSISIFCMSNSVEIISVDSSSEYNSSTDTNLVNGDVE